MNLFEGNLYIQTGKVKAVSREMTANPKVELCAFDGETWLRVSAKAVEDDRVQARQDLLDHYPELQSLYTADDGNTQVSRSRRRPRRSAASRPRRAWCAGKKRKKETARDPRRIAGGFSVCRKAGSTQ